MLREKTQYAYTKYYGNDIKANVAEVSTEHLLNDISTSFGIVCFVTQNNTFPVHHAVTTCAHIVWSKLYFGMKC